MSLNYRGNEHHAPYNGTNKTGRMTLGEAKAEHVIVFVIRRRKRRRALKRRIRELV